MSASLKIALAGEGGQGVQSVAEIISEAAYAAGYQSLYIPNFGVEQRGGVSLAFIQISEEQISAPKFMFADVAVALSRRAVDRSRQYVGSETLLVYDESVQDEVHNLYGDAQKQLAIPALAVAQQEMHPRVFNVIILGVLMRVAGLLERRHIVTALERRLGHKFAQDSSLRELNYNALERGYQMGKEGVAI